MLFVFVIYTVRHQAMELDIQISESARTLHKFSGPAFYGFRHIFVRGDAIKKKPSGYCSSDRNCEEDDTVR